MAYLLIPNDALDYTKPDLIIITTVIRRIVINRDRWLQLWIFNISAAK